MKGAQINMRMHKGAVDRKLLQLRRVRKNQLVTLTGITLLNVAHNVSFYIPPVEVEVHLQLSLRHTSMAHHVMHQANQKPPVLHRRTNQPTHRPVPHFLVNQKPTVKNRVPPQRGRRMQNSTALPGVLSHSPLTRTASNQAG